MSASFKGFYKAAKFYSQKPQVCSSISEADLKRNNQTKLVVFPYLRCTSSQGAAASPACIQNHCTGGGWHIIPW